MEASTLGSRALAELRAVGIIRAFGLGVNEADAMLDAMNEAELDCTLLAGRHTLVEQSATLLREKAAECGMAVILRGAFNSGILAAGRDGDGKFNYQDVPEHI